MLSKISTEAATIEEINRVCPCSLLSVSVYEPVISRIARIDNTPTHKLYMSNRILSKILATTGIASFTGGSTKVL